MKLFDELSVKIQMLQVMSASLTQDIWVWKRV